MESNNISDIRRTIKHQCAFLTVLVIHTILTVIAVLICLVAIISIDVVLKHIKSQGTKVDLSNGTLWGIRISIVVVLLLIILFSYCGWRGYLRLTFIPLLIFSILYALNCIGLFIGFFFEFTVSSIISFLITLLLTTYSFLFSFEVKKFRDENSNAYQMY